MGARTSAFNAQPGRENGPVVFIVIEDATLRERARVLIEAAGLRSCCFADANGLLAQAPRREPSCLVLGAEVSGRSASETLLEFGRRHVRVPTLVVTGEADVSGAVAAMRAGAVDVIESSALPHQLASAALKAISTDLCERIADLEAESVRQRFASLTRREREVVQLVVQGETSGGIATQLGLREKTVEIYRSHINKKMQARNAAELTKLMLTLR